MIENCLEDSRCKFNRSISNTALTRSGLAFAYLIYSNNDQDCISYHTDDMYLFTEIVGPSNISASSNNFYDYYYSEHNTRSNILSASRVNYKYHSKDLYRSINDIIEHDYEWGY